MIDINAALGMTSERPLQVCETCNGTGVEVTNEQYGNGTYIEVVCECRLVDPPRERDEVAELRERLAIAIADRDSFMESYQKISESMDELKQQLSQVTRERDEYKQRAGSNQSYGVDSGSACGRNYLSVCGFVVAVEGDTQRDSKLASRFGSPWNKDAINYVVEQSKEKDGELVTLREQLATEQAEAAAMRNAIELAGEGLAEYADGSEILHDADCPQDDTCDCAHLRKLTEAQRLMHKCINGTAGREWLDRHKAEIAAKDAEIEAYKVETARLRKMWMDYDGLIVRLERKCRTAKVALVETYRGKIDGAWFGETEPIYWQMPEDNQCTWRCIDGQRLQVRFNGGEWEAAFAYSSVSEIDKYLPRCNADGTPLEKPLTQTADISETSGVKDAALLRKLREWIRNGVFTVVGNSVVIGCQCIPTELAELLISIRDGGAK